MLSAPTSLQFFELRQIIKFFFIHLFVDGKLCQNSCSHEPDESSVL